MASISPCQVGLIADLFHPSATTSPVSPRTITAPKGRRGHLAVSAMARRMKRS